MPRNKASPTRYAIIPERFPTIVPELPSAPAPRLIRHNLSPVPARLALAPIEVAFAPTRACARHHSVHTPCVPTNRLTTSGVARSCLYECRVMHHRLLPRRHRFEYGLFLACLDLDELDDADRSLRLFSHNRKNLYEFRDSDHFIRSGAPDGANSGQSLKTRVLAWLTDQGVAPGRDCRIDLVTLPRVAGYVFNPVSFYFVAKASGQPICAVAEVGNTFGEQKPYLVPLEGDPPRLDLSAAGGADAKNPRGLQTHKPPRTNFRLVAPKHFYVSPFSELDLRFDFRLAQPDEDLTVGVNDLNAQGETVLVSSLTGRRRPLVDQELIRLTARYPLVTARVITLIHWQALRLWLKRVPFFAKAERPSLQQGVLHRPAAHRRHS